MGGGASSSRQKMKEAYHQRQEAETKRKGKVGKFRAFVRKDARLSTQQLGGMTVRCEVETEPWKFTDVEMDFTSAFRYFNGAQIEIEAAFAGRTEDVVDPRLETFDFSKAIVLSLKSVPGGGKGEKLLACLIAMEHQISAKTRTIELLWFVTLPQYAGRGLGRCLFQHLLQLAHYRDASAVLVQADATDLPTLGWWLTHAPLHPEVGGRLCTVVLSSMSQAKVLKQVKKLEPKPVRKKGKGKRVKDDKKKKTKNSKAAAPPTLEEQLAAIDFQKKPANSTGLGSFYQRKGMGFKATPYRYGLAAHMHVWFFVPSPRELEAYKNKSAGGSLSYSKGGGDKKKKKKKKKVSKDVSSGTAVLREKERSLAKSASMRRLRDMSSKGEVGLMTAVGKTVQRGTKGVKIGKGAPKRVPVTKQHLLKI